jgi:ATP synthase F1 subcomplex gamma subunit 
MPSLKDLRLRIASVKATRKITKAMQMVAAAKLRRAQDMALAARPYAERMDDMLAKINARIGLREGAPPLLVGTGKQETYLFIVATAERGLCGAFNSNIVKLAREEIRRKLAQGKTVKILCVGRKGHDALKREYGRHIIETVDLRAVKRLGYDNALDVSRRVIRLFNAGEFDVAVLFFSEFKNILTQKPTAMQLIPAQIPAEKPSQPQISGAAAEYEFEPGRGNNPSRPPAAQHRHANLPRAARERRGRTGRAHDGDGQRHAQRRRDDQQADAALQPSAPGKHHQGTDRDHSGAEAV